MDPVTTSEFKEALALVRQLCPSPFISLFSPFVIMHVLYPAFTNQ